EIDFGIGHGRFSFDGRAEGAFLHAPRAASSPSGTRSEAGGVADVFCLAAKTERLERLDGDGERGSEKSDRAGAKGREVGEESAEHRGAGEREAGDLGGPGSSI